jgi:hypothetical protein
MTIDQHKELALYNGITHTGANNPVHNWMTIDEHRKLALYLHEIRDRISGIGRITYPKLHKRSRASENVGKLQRTVDDLRCLLDALMYEQYIDAPEPSFYYTNGRRRWNLGVSDVR